MISLMHRIYPDGPVDADLTALYGDVRRPAVDGRPWVGLSMIASLDGATAVSGLSGGLGNDNDRAVFTLLRSVADVILVGAATAEAEGYRPSSRPGQRIGVVSRSGRVDTNTELFESGQGFLVLPDNVGETPPGVDCVRAGDGTVDFVTALHRLADLIPAAKFVQAEGGPRLNAALLDAGCIDELDFTVAPALAGGSSSRIIAGAAEGLQPFRLVHVLVDADGYLFTRWVRPDRAC